MIKWLENNRNITIIITILIAIGIFLCSSISGTNIRNIGIDLSPIYHFTAFFLLSFFFLISLSEKGKIKTKFFLIVVITSILYAILDEIHQIFVPFRSPDIGDVLVDSLGIIIAALIYFYYKKKIKL